MARRQRAIDRCHSRVLVGEGILLASFQRKHAFDMSVLPTTLHALLGCTLQHPSLRDFTQNSEPESVKAYSGAQANGSDQAPKAEVLVQMLYTTTTLP